ncbi:MAG: alpha/beta fold hydrolase [Solirubrobacterales bacterium]
MSFVFEHRPRVGGVKTRALELEGPGPLIVLFHGYADSADTWRPLLDQLRRRALAAVAYDMPGFGAASRLRRDRMILPQLDAFAAAVVERHPDQPLIVVGNSLGGVVAMRMAQQPPPRLAAIAPIAPAGLSHPRWFSVIESTPVIQRVLRAPVPIPGAVVRAGVARSYRTLAFSRPGVADPRAVAAFAGHLRTRRDVIRVLATGRRLLPELADPFELERIAVPTSLLWGSADRMVGIDGARHVLDAVDGSTLQRLQGCGHCPQIEEPEATARFVEGVVADAVASGGALTARS